MRDLHASICEIMSLSICWRGHRTEHGVFNDGQIRPGKTLTLQRSSSGAVPYENRIPTGGRL